MTRLFVFLLIACSLIFLYCDKNSTNPQPVELTILTPDGGDVWFLHGNVDITWSSKNAGPTIKIDISRDNGVTWEQITETINNGSLTWTVLGDASDTVLLRLTDVKNGTTATLDSPILIKALGTLDVDFYLQYVAEPYPTYQTVVWLEHENGAFIKSLFVSDWLANGGFNSRYVCSTWSSKAKWSEGGREAHVDAMTGPTPTWGVESQYSFDLTGRGVGPGLYKCNIETHITGDYNVVYSGDLEIRGENTSAEPSPVFMPEQHQQAGLVLTNVKMQYVFTTD